MAVICGEQCNSVGVRLLADPFHGGSKGIIAARQLVIDHIVRLVCILRSIFCFICFGQGDHAGHLSGAQLHLRHLAVHIAGDHGQGAAVLARLSHDAHRLDGHNALLGLRLRCRLLLFSVQIQHRNAILGLQRHGLGGRGLIEHDVAGFCGAAARILQDVRPLQIAAQCQHTGTLGHRALRHTGKLQAVGQEHHIPFSVRVAVPGAVTGIAAHGRLIFGIQFEVFLTFLIAQLALRHRDQIFRPAAVQGDVGCSLPLFRGLHIDLLVRQALHRVVVLRERAHQFFGVAGVGVVMNGFLVRILCRGGRLDHDRAGGHRHLVGDLFLVQLAVFLAADQHILRGVAAVIVDVLKLAADQSAFFVKAVIRVLVLFLEAGQLLLFLIARIGMDVRHQNGLGLQFILRFCIHTKIGIQVRFLRQAGSLRVFRLALLVTAGQHLFVAGLGVLVFLIAAVIVCRHGNAHAMQLPVDKQRRHQRQHQQHGHIAPRLPVPLPELFRQICYNVFHPSLPLYFCSAAQKCNKRVSFQTHTLLIIPSTHRMFNQKISFLRLFPCFSGHYSLCSGSR